MNVPVFIEEIENHILNDDLAAALQKLQILLKNTPQLNEVIHQSGRFQDIKKQIRLGVVSHKEATLTKNQIRAGLLDFLSEINTQGRGVHIIQQELEKAISIVNSKNVFIGTAQGNVTIGDKIIQTETKTSRWIRLFLFLFVPLLSIGGAYLWNQSQVSKRPLNLNVSIKNKTPHPKLGEPSGTLTLTYGGQPNPQEGISTSAIFQNIPTKYREEEINLTYQAKGFVPIDTTFQYQATISLGLSRNNDFAILKGHIKDEEGNDLKNVKAFLSCCDISAMTDADGIFVLPIPFKYQDDSQRITLSKTNYQSKDYLMPVIFTEIASFVLPRK